MKRSLFNLIATLLVLGIFFFAGLLFVDLTKEDNHKALPHNEFSSQSTNDASDQKAFSGSIGKEAYASIENHGYSSKNLPIIDPPKYEIFNSPVPSETPDANVMDSTIIQPPETEKSSEDNGDTETMKKNRKDFSTPEPRNKPKVAIIIDDMGYDLRMAEKLFNLKAVITYSILPFSPFRDDMLKITSQKGYETLLHLPMEPLEYPRFDPGPGVLLTNMSSDEITTVLLDDIRNLPGIKGVNNHMGSSFTRDAEGMRVVFSVLKQQGLFFVNSKTATETVCETAARDYHLPYAERDVFLDHVQTPEFVKGQIKLMIMKAYENGVAIGIGHPHSVTYEVLKENLPYIDANVVLVPVSELVGLSG